MSVAFTRRFAVPVAVLAATIGLMAAVPAAAAAPAVASPAGLPAGSQYVAMGDSYSAGYGIMPYSNQPIPACQQSSQDFPRQIAALYGLALTDVTCSGAETANIDQTPQTEFANGETGSAPLQDSVLSTSTKLVTLSIGGNDLGFSSIAEQCFALAANGPVAGPLPVPTGSSPFQNANCSSFLAAPTQALLTSTVAPAIARVLADIKAKAPNAKIFVVEYPAVAPDAANTPSAGCFRAALGSSGVIPPYPADSYPFTTTDVPFLNQIEGALNAVIATATANAGGTFVPTFAATESHSPCAATADQFVNGITITDIDLNSNPPSVTEAPGALHPNVNGVSYLTSQVQSAVEAAFTGSGIGLGAPPSVTPSTPSSTSPQLAATGAAHAAGLSWLAIALVVAGAALTGLGWRGRRRVARATSHRARP